MKKSNISDKLLMPENLIHAKNEVFWTFWGQNGKITPIVIELFSKYSSRRFQPCI